MDNLNVFTELLAIGLIALIALFLNLIGIYDIQFDTIKVYTELLKDYNTVILVLMLAVSYLLGFFINKISRFILASYFYNKNIQSLLSECPEEFGKFRDYVYIKSSTHSAEKIKELISTIRMLRSGIILSILFSIGFFRLELFLLSVSFFIASIVFTIFTYFSYKDYVIRIVNTYKCAINN